MAAFPCPYCGYACVTDSDAEAKLDRCPSCDGSLLIAYRYRLEADHGDISGGRLYRAIDDGFNEPVAVLFVDEPDDRRAVERFVEGNRLFADIAGRGLNKIHDVGSPSDPRAYVVMDWLAGGTLDRVVARRGPLDQASLLALVNDLLTGLSKAHRSMPAVIHGHIHPGKIGFVETSAGPGSAVLFGFEWARQVNAQASQLAYSYSTDDDDDDQRNIAGDLRQLAVVFFYAVTGEWIGELARAAQRERARQLPGPLARLIDRMLGAGEDGYRSAVDAAVDFEQLMRGDDRWQAPTLQAPDRSEERMGTAWAPVSAQALAADADADDDDQDGDGLDDDLVEVLGPEAAEMIGGVRSSPPPPPARAAQQNPNWNAWAAQQQALAQQQAQAQTQAKAGRGVVIFIAVAIAFTTCVAGIIEDISEPDLPPPPPQARGVPQRIEPIPTPEPIPEPPPPAPALLDNGARLSGTFRYEGKITGPAEFAGLALGERCEVWIEPNDSALNCRWYVDCGKPRRRIYGGGDVGFSQCSVGDAGQPLSAQDLDDDAPDGAFTAELDGEDPLVLVYDRWIEPPVHVLISIEAGGPTSQRVPKLEQAPRVPAEFIEMRIAKGIYPQIEPGVIGDW